MAGILAMPIRTSARLSLTADQNRQIGQASISPSYSRSAGTVAEIR